VLASKAATVSSGQDLTVQQDVLRKADVQAIFEEKISGTKRDNRKELGKVLHILGEGDTLVVTRLDRLGRSMRDLANIAHEIESAGANLKVMEQHVDTSTSAGRAFFGMLAVFAAFETDVRRERQAEGIAKAKRSCIYRGGVKRIDRTRVGRSSREVPGRAPSLMSWASRVDRSTAFWRRNPLSIANFKV
jgi:DNA invertase Pin-like site-specific DNA recombinase